MGPKQPLEPAYTYTATVEHWVDGDTVDLKVDLGFKMWVADRFRLYGIDTPERGQKGHDEATAFNVEHLPVGAACVVRTYKAHEKYGRYLADLYIPGEEISLNAQLLAARLANPYFGGAKTP